jgi:DNA-binding transcriptional MerR regulator
VDDLPDKRYFKIGEAARIVGVEPYVLRYWEKEFGEIRPGKSRSGQRLYRREDVALLRQIRHLLHEERFTIAGARRHLGLSRGGTAPGDSRPVPTQPAVTLPGRTVAGEPAAPACATDPALMDRLRREVGEILALVEEDEDLDPPD